MGLLTATKVAESVTYSVYKGVQRVTYLVLLTCSKGYLPGLTDWFKGLIIRLTDCYKGY